MIFLTNKTFRLENLNFSTAHIWGIFSKMLQWLLDFFFNENYTTKLKITTLIKIMQLISLDAF